MVVMEKVNYKKILKYSYWTGVHLLAMVGVVFIGVFFAIKFKVTDVSGKVDDMDTAFEQHARENQVLGISTSAVASVSSDSGKKAADVNVISQQISELNRQKEKQEKYWCTLEELSYTAPKNTLTMMKIKKETNSDFIFGQMLFAVQTHLENKEQFDTEVNKCVQNFDATKVNEDEISQRCVAANAKNIFEWPDKKEWFDVMASIVKDKDKINRAASVAKIEPRIIVSSLMVEQLRLFYSQRELYKKYFEPLKILANSYQISLGVMAIKEETAQQIENHLKDRSSPYYLGTEYENLLDYPDGVDKGTERFNRLSNNDHYWNYLYGALYLKQMLVQWNRAGYDLTARPEIIGTLFNVGFAQSKPNANPKVGGSTVVIDQTNYSFGRLSYEFYYSGEMTDDFPYLNNL